MLTPTCLFCENYSRAYRWCCLLGLYKKPGDGPCALFKTIKPDPNYDTPKTCERCKHWTVNKMRIRRPTASTWIEVGDCPYYGETEVGDFCDKEFEAKS